MAVGVSYRHRVAAGGQTQSGERVLAVLDLQDGTPLRGGRVKDVDLTEETTTLQLQEVFSPLEGS